MIYLQLFLSYLKIGFFGFGGGYAMLPILEREIEIRTCLSGSGATHARTAVRIPNANAFIGRNAAIGSIINIEILR